MGNDGDAGGDEMSLELLVARADDQRPVLERGLSKNAAFLAPCPEPRRDAFDFLHDGRDSSSLAEARWGLVAPEGAAGDRLLELVATLRKTREEQQGAPAVVHRVPRGLSAEDAEAWCNDIHGDVRVDHEKMPRYLLVVGDADLIPWALQKRLAWDAYVGRLSFAEEAGYEAYAEKLCRSERASPAHGARLLCHSARDGSAAMEVAHDGIMVPTLQQSHLGHEQQTFPVREILTLGEDKPASVDDFFALTASRKPSLLFSISHGLGAPRAGFASFEERRLFQGAMSFGGGAHVTGEDVRTRPFLPGGMWILFAGFGAGTPRTSVYLQWLSRLRESPFSGPRLEDLLRVMPRQSERPFTAALPLAALANPNGPLAIMGHTDLAWALRSRETGTGNRYRPSRFQEVFHKLACGKRAGVSLFELQRLLYRASVGLSVLCDNDAHPMARGGGSLDGDARKRRKVTLWLLAHDLHSIVLLGDPAARLPVAPTMT